MQGQARPQSPEPQAQGMEPVRPCLYASLPVVSRPPGRFLCLHWFEFWPPLPILTS